MFGIENDFQNLMEQVYGPLNKDKMTEIEKTEKEIKLLQKKLELLKEMEKHKSPVEEAYKDWWGEYPSTESVCESEDMRWAGFQAGYNAAYKEPEDTVWKSVALRFGEKLSDIGPCGYYEFSPDEWFEWAVNTYEKLADDWLILLNKEKQLRTLTEKLQKKDWKVDVKTNLKPHWEPKPQEPEEVAEGLKKAFREAVKQGVVSSNTKPQTLYDVIADWWDEIFTNGNPSGQNIESLVEQIVKLLPDAIIEPDEDWDYGYNDYRYKIMKKFKGR